MGTKKRIRNYILENYLFTDDQSLLDDDTSLMQKGIVDSTGILEIIFFINEEFEVQIEDHEMIPENLDSVDNIVSFVKSKGVAA